MKAIFSITSALFPGIQNTRDCKYARLHQQHRACKLDYYRATQNPLRISFDNHVTVRCQTTLGKVVDELDAEIEGESVEIGFNNMYLLDALRYSGCDKVALKSAARCLP